MADNLEIYKQLEALVLVDEGGEFQQIEQTLRVFCPFEAMGTVDAEIRHSNFLANMLDPYGSHGFGEDLLRSLIDAILRKRPDALTGLSRLTLHLGDFDQAIIRREWNRIDLLIEMPAFRLVLAFELKINARESKGQLARYKAAVEEQWPASGERPWRQLFFFLTTKSTTPSEESWQPISYEVVVDAIAAVLKRNEATRSLAIMMLAAYSDMLRRHHMEDEELVQIAQSLWRRHPEALRFLMDQQPDESNGFASLLKTRIGEIAHAASAKAIALTADQGPESVPRLYIEGWNVRLNGSQSKQLLWIALRYQRNQVYGRLVLGPGAHEIRKAIFEKVSPHMERTATLSDRWTRLASAVLLGKADLEGDFDQDQAIQKLKEQLKDFVEAKVSRFDAPIRAALAECAAMETSNEAESAATT